MLVPRSPIAELILQRFAPWVDARRRAPDSGYRHRLGRDRAGLRHGLSPRAGGCRRYLRRRTARSCRRNVRRLGAAASGSGCCNRIISPPCAGCRYDIIVSNPPYVGRAEMRALPREYRHEPRAGAGRRRRRPGLGEGDLCRGATASEPMTAFWSWKSAIPKRALMRAFPRLPFVWPEIAMGGGGVFLLRAADL